MTGKALADRVAAYLLAVLIVCGAATAAAIEFDLPGERRMAVNGFYEMRLNAVGEDLPANGATWSQFRHVVSLETETELFPDGIGPFDVMMAFTRWLVTYECIYERACGLGKAADSFGGSKRSINRAPRTLGSARSATPFAGGLLPQEHRRRSLVPARAKMNPGRRYRDMIDGPGEFGNPNPFSGLANLNARTQLDGPIDSFAPVWSRTRAGAYNANWHLNLLTAARAFVGEENYVKLQPKLGTYLRLPPAASYPDDPGFGALAGQPIQWGLGDLVQVEDFLRADLELSDRTTIPGQCGLDWEGNTGPCSTPAKKATQYKTWVKNSYKWQISVGREEMRALNAVIARSEGSDDQAVVLARAAAISRRDELLKIDTSLDLTVENSRLDTFTLNPDLYDAYEFPGEYIDDYRPLNLMSSRPDPNAFEKSAKAQAPELLDSMWAGLERSEMGYVPYLASIDTPIRPLGYLGTAEAVDFIVNSSTGVARDVGKLDINVVNAFNLVSADTDSSKLNQELIAGVIGPDGVFDTADDLPFYDKNEFVQANLGADGGLTRRVIDPGLPGYDPTSIGMYDQTVHSEFARGWSAQDYDTVVTVNGIKDQNPVTGGNILNRPANGTDIVLYGEFKTNRVLDVGCRYAEGRGKIPGLQWNGSDCVDAGGQPLGISTEELFLEGCDHLNQFAGGVNQDGKCVRLNADNGLYPEPQGKQRTGVHFAVALELGNANFRPASAALEPTDSTDFNSYARNRVTPPARPRAEGNRLNFVTTGLQKLMLESHSIVSNLDLGFSEDELRWGHGAMEDEHEFREGYLEFEMFDSALFARVGKLLMVWGKTELARNQDRLNPLDISNGVITRLEEARIGMWAADLTFSPESWMRVGPVQDLRVEIVGVFDDFEPTDLGKCGESSSIALVCAKAVGAMANGLVGIGLVGETRPDKEYSTVKRMDFGMRVEGRWDRVTFAISDFWGWEDDMKVDTIHTYERRVDPNTGAPVRANGPQVCEYRTAEGGSSSDLALSVGPDNDPATKHDNMIPTAGNCLLWDDPEGDELQDLRASEAIARDHSVNQQLFHTFCTYTFDPDAGFCAFDRLNSPDEFKLVAQALAGLGVVTDIVLSGLETLRLDTMPFREQLSVTQTDRVFAKIIGTKQPGQRPPDDADGTFALGFDLNGAQAALLGCGPVYASPCGTFATQHGWVWDEDEPNDRSGSRAMGAPTTDTGQVADGTAQGGVDLMNADGSVIGQEFLLLKALSPGAMVGIRNRDGTGAGPLRWEPGITVAGRSAVELAKCSNCTAELFSRMNLMERADYLEENFDFDFSTAPDNIDPLYGNRIGVKKSDGWIEPFPWAVDEEALARGDLMFQVADQYRVDLRCNPELQPGGGNSDPAQSQADEWRKAVPRETDEGGKPVFSSYEVGYCKSRNSFWSPERPLDAPVLNDPTDVTNLANSFYGEYDEDDFDNGLKVNEENYKQALRVAESCSPFLRDQPRDLEGLTDFSEGCTKLEAFSNNLERLFMVLDIKGSDSFFDPPETFEELKNILDADYSTDELGDPVAGPDGIYVDNFNLFEEEGYYDIQAVEYMTVGAGQPDVFDITKKENIEAFDLDGDGKVSESEFFQVYSPQSQNYCPGNGTCFLKVGDQADLVSSAFGLSRPLVAMLPIRQPAQVFLGSSWIPISIDLFEIELHDVTEFNDLLMGRTIDACLSNFNDQNECATQELPVRLTGGQVFDIMREKDINQPTNWPSYSEPVIIRDLDEDEDGVYDGLDDHTRGPITDDNILCGSGIPGDTLQNAMQYDLSRPELDKATAVWGTKELRDGSVVLNLPSRNSTQCVTTALLGATGQTLALRKAGGDGNYGRRDFMWQGGKQLVINYDKNNVFGFALDFAEDKTQTSWGIEGSWTADKRISDTTSPSGYSKVDDFLVSISIDRPTFVNFINPNRSFFVNFQFFVRYIKGYKGGRDDRDGMYGTAEGPWSGFITMTAFTGYFQDRLNPGITLALDPTTSTAAAFWRLGYKFSGNFSTSLRVNQFWGHPTKLQRAYFPALPYSDNREWVEGRGISVVRNRDEVFWNLRYTW